MNKRNRFFAWTAAATLSIGMMACGTTRTTDVATTTDVNNSGTVTTTTTATTTETAVNNLDYTPSGLNRDNTYADGVTDPTSVKQATAMNKPEELKVTPNIGTTGNVEALATKRTDTSVTTSTTALNTTPVVTPVVVETTTTTTDTTADTSMTSSSDDTTASTTTTTHRRMSKD
jgi:hypothetical protein